MNQEPSLTINIIATILIWGFIIYGLIIHQWILIPASLCVMFGTALGLLNNKKN